ncbi:type I DNA topoisomerase [Azotobacter chroococcum]|uniref:DNA topoisomerase 1 n=1 Tax=Azotobacter chroococcum TaxID=353 RepID=A0A4R1PKH2_9GAMM|nr:type I DNA topoisomerase [Azotobacter chroococcum]TBV99918.1 type I DNA topoisomerase [Azotobacter chroococcum]TCL31637.1 DNA topoisomerase I [Azotobacter chroococcum]
MGKSLVIVESPAKAKTINKYLGSQYVVKSSIGHIRDLPTSGSASTAREPAKRGKSTAEAPALSPKEKAKRQLFARMGVDPEHGWKAHYEILPGKEKVVDELRRLAQEADTIYLATDLDREGEAIAWHLRESIGGDDSRYKRVVFNEITKKAIQEAFAQPGELDINRVNAQQARRFLDRVVGYMVSPLLWQKIARGLSAGRVQSVAVKLIAEREREIRAFIPEEFWEIHADLGTAKGAQVRFEVARENGEAFRPLNEAQALAALEKLKASSYRVAKREDKPTRSKPSAPFITSTLQQAASNRLGFSVKKTMMMAQRLYEAGYITYMRTDSTNLSADALEMARGFIEGEFGAQYLPAQPNLYTSKEGAQEAHEAIRPSDVNLQPTQLSGMERDAERLYELIWRQFVACQMPPAEYLSTSVSVQAGAFELRAKGRILKFDGYTRVLPQLAKPGEDDVLPDMAEGEGLDLLKLDPSQHFTKPPARYSEASLVKEMEKRGIGRPSTYAAIISTIQERGYVALQNRRFHSEKMGDIVTERLAESFANLMDYGFTASMEEHLDDVAQGERDWKHLLDEFYGDFRKKLDIAESSEAGMRANQPTLTDIPCRECGRPMMIRTASTGVFLGCSGYSLPPKERCKSTINLIPGDEIAADDEGESESLLLRNKRRCPKCGTAMDAYLLDEQHKLHICGNNPDCSGYEIEEGQYRIKGYEGPSLECDKCGSQMQLKTGRFGKFFGCTNAACKNTRKLLKSGEPAPPKMDAVKMPELRCEKVDDVYVLRDGASGLFLAASQFPKNRETRAPLVLELLPHRDEIDPKYHFLLDAPAEDPEGRPAVIRYSRKSKEQYVQSEVEGKPSGWRAFYQDGRWVVEDKR